MNIQHSAYNNVVLRINLDRKALQRHRAWSKFATEPTSAQKRYLTPSFGFVVPDGVGTWPRRRGKCPKPMQRRCT